MVVGDSESARGVSRSDRGTVSQRQNSSNFLAAESFHYRVRGIFRRREVHRDGLIAPGIFELVAAIGDVNELDTQFARGVPKALGLVTQLRSEEQQTLGRMVARGR